MSIRGAGLSALLIMGVAFGVRLWHLSFLEASPLANALMGDSVGYDAWAREVAAGDWFGSEVFYQAPLYPYFLASLYAVAGDELRWVRLVQAALGATACGLLLLATTRFFQSLAAGILAGVTLAFYAPGIFHDSLIQKSVLDLFFLCLLLWILSRLIDRPRPGAWCAAGAILGCLILTRENATGLLVAILVWLVFQFREAGRQRVVFAMSFVVGLGLVLGPVAARNYALSGEMHVTTSQLGSNFYIGNHEHATGTYVPLRWGRGSSQFEQKDATELAEIATGQRLNPRQVSQYWESLATEYIVTHPVDWLRLTGLKFALLWNATEIIDTEDQYTYAEFSPPLRWTGQTVHFGIIAPLALLGLVVTWDRRRRVWLLYAMTACYASSVLLFYVVARYRLPLAPLLIPFAAAGLAGLPGWLRHTRLRQIALTGAAVFLFAVFGHWNLVDREGMRAATYYNLGLSLGMRGDRGGAISHYRKALEIFPNHSEALINLAGELALEGNRAEAMSLYERALRVAPEVGAVHGRVATALVAEGRFDEALEQFAQAVQLDPHLAPAHYGMALVLVGKGRAREGFTHMQTAATLDPGIVKRLRGTTWNLAATPSPRRSGQVARALILARWVHALSDPDDPAALDILAVATAANGRFQEAIALTDKAIKLAEAAEQPQLVGALTLRRAFYVRKAPFIRRPSANQPD